MNIALKPVGTLLAMLAATAAMAEENGLRYGIQASFATPTVADFDLYDGKYKMGPFLSAGLSVAGTAEWSLSPKSAIRAKVEYLRFGEKDSQPEIEISGSSGPDAFYFSGLKYGMKAVALGADYIYGFKSNEVGPYVFGGIGYHITLGSGGTYSIYVDAHTGEMIMSDHLDLLDGRGNAVGASLGAGCRFTGNLACELRFTALGDLAHNVGAHSRETYKIDLNWLQVGLCYRF